MNYRMLVNGDLINGPSVAEVINPATARAFTTCPRADLELLQRAVDAADAAFPRWSKLPFAERRDSLLQLADAMEARFAEFSTLLTREQGKPLAQAQFEIGGSIMALRYFATIELADRSLRDSTSERIFEHRTPLGVVAAITPWNFPMILLMLKIAPALACGNVVICKPAPTTPLTTLLLGELAAEILPPGVMSTLVDQNDLGVALTSHPRIAKVSFTGSTATGKKVMASAAGSLKRLTLELGGNDPAIVLDDADVAKVAPEIFNAAMLNAGQVCLAAKRIYVPRAMHGALFDALGKIVRDAIVGDGLDPRTQIGPIQNRMQYDRVLQLMEQSRGSAVSIVSGGKPQATGYFIAPAVVSGLSDEAPLVAQEQFGPVMPVLTYDSLDEVVARANASPYGLGATVWTSNPERGIELARRIESGTVWVNKHMDLPFDVPFGGCKQSGIGREQGMAGVEEFTQARIVNASLIH
jgi:acyl-CoA reductase-like NAD-dependent aldehyde dehydrogenase